MPLYKRHLRGAEPPLIMTGGRGGKAGTEHIFIYSLYRYLQYKSSPIGKKMQKYTVQLHKGARRIRKIQNMINNYLQY